MHRPAKTEKKRGHREKIGRKLEAATSCAPWSRAPAALAGVAQELAEDESPPFFSPNIRAILEGSERDLGHPKSRPLPRLG